MREIKFRAWHEGLKCMSRVLELDFQHNAIRCVPGHLPKNRLSDVVLLQYTGLKDKNGKEIWEGDIVTNAGPYHNNQVVEWDNAGFFPFADSPSNCGCCGGGNSPKSVEVIGNVYETPELLNK